MDIREELEASPELSFVSAPGVGDSHAHFFQEEKRRRERVKLTQGEIPSLEIWDPVVVCINHLPS